MSLRTWTLERTPDGGAVRRSHPLTRSDQPPQPDNTELLRPPASIVPRRCELDRLDASASRRLITPQQDGRPLPGAAGDAAPDVRIHIDARAQNLAASFSAKAFTYGRDIYFSKGRFAPETSEGRSLLDHELGHVAEQAGLPPVVQRDPEDRQRLSLRPTLTDLYRFQLQREAPVEAWLADHESALRGSSLASLVTRIRSDLGDRVSALADAEIQAVVRRWAGSHDIRLGDLVAASPSGGSAVDLGAAARSISSALSSIPTELGFDQSHGWALLRFSGPTIGLRTSRAQAGSSIGWDGTLNLDSQFDNFRFRGSLSRERWELRLGYRIGQAMPDIGNLSTIFTNAQEAIGNIASITASLDDPVAAAGAIGDEVRPVRQAIRAAEQIGRARPGVSFQIDPRLFGRMPGGPTDQPPVGFSLSARFTLVF
jgi:hypothetical protein